MDDKQLNRRTAIIGQIKYLAMFVLIIAVFSLFFKRTETVKLSFVEETIVLETASGFVQEVEWDDILSVEQREALDVGTLRSGTDDGKERSGSWENDEFGAYTLCMDQSVEAYLVLNTTEGVLVVNCGSPEMTQSLGEAVERILSGEY